LHLPAHWERRLFVGGLFFFAFWLLVALPFFYSVPRYSGNDETTNQCSGEESKNHGFWEKASCDPTAYFTLWLVAFTGVLAISTIGLWIVTWRASASQARDMKDSIDVAERALVAGERAWVRVDVSNNGDLVFDDNGNARLNLLFTLTNIGNSRQQRSGSTRIPFWQTSLAPPQLPRVRNMKRFV
jgi:hypothetical protein